MLLQTGLSGIAPTYLREEDRLIPITFRLAERRAGADRRNQQTRRGQHGRPTCACRSARSPISRRSSFRRRSGAATTSGASPSSATRCPACWPADRGARFSRGSTAWPGVAARLPLPVRRRVRGAGQGFRCGGPGPDGLAGGDLPGAGAAIQQRDEAAGGICRRALRHGRRHDGPVPLRHAVRVHGLPGRGLLGRRDRQPRHRACSTISRRPASAANRCGKR